MSTGLLIVPTALPINIKRCFAATDRRAIAKSPQGDQSPGTGPRSPTRSFKVPGAARSGRARAT